ncbi:hypothetical protein PILCRDRAFT_11977 [Piloderma croceum F 1598]|uniref:Uncharacterized protein n=1 Tax=Piloderma croceum (strain F 1598) TaxID=765440 RepID=A0A0C3FCL7_PILCF|nr:hypothetical protein PILCRDRAFT_11977 [Piloderma croceum F 1598]
MRNFAQKFKIVDCASGERAEVLEESSETCIKDVKSSARLLTMNDSHQKDASKPYEFKSDDIFEFSIDIVGEDNETIIHCKKYHPHRRSRQTTSTSEVGGGDRLCRRKVLKEWAGWKWQKTRAELHNLSGVMNGNRDSIGGLLPANLPPQPYYHPLFNLPPRSSELTQLSTSPAASALTEFQTQLHDAQSPLLALLRHLMQVGQMDVLVGWLPIPLIQPALDIGIKVSPTLSPSLTSSCDRSCSLPYPSRAGHEIDPIAGNSVEVTSPTRQGAREKRHYGDRLGVGGWRSMNGGVGGEA